MSSHGLVMVLANKAELFDCYKTRDSLQLRRRTRRSVTGGTIDFRGHLKKTENGKLRLLT